MSVGRLRKVTRQVKSGFHGRSRWVIELECGHVTRSARKSPKTHRRCNSCLTTDNDHTFEIMDYSHLEAKLAHSLGVDSSQLTVSEYGGQVNLTTYDVARLTA